MEAELLQYCEYTGSADLLQWAVGLKQ